ncbi:hypothetical protein T484DRAFT_1819310 [Baffinella frigidus]|nr:hypothetical protein T484DRAFT_1819310 [Cryptophyta sp. CCMP2293]
MRGVSVAAVAAVASLMALATPATAFSPCSFKLPLRAAGREVCSVRMSAQDMRGSRRWSIGVLPAAVVLAGVAPQLVLAADDVAAAAPTGGTFLQRAVRIRSLALLVPELSEELPFWTDGLGMKVLQSSAGKAVLGYGPEGQGSASGGHFAIELFEDADESIKPPVGWQRMEVVLPYTTNRVLNVEEAGGKLLPRWFGTANFVEVGALPGSQGACERAESETKVVAACGSVRANRESETLVQTALAQ